MYRGYHDPNPKRTAVQKLADATRVYRENAEDDPAFRARFGNEPLAVLTSTIDADALIAAGTPLDVRGSSQVQRNIFYLGLDHSR